MVDPSIPALGWSLIHFLWEGTIVAIIVAIAMRALARRTAETRYAFASLSLLAMGALPIFTYFRVRAHASGFTTLGQTIVSHPAQIRSTGQAPLPLTLDAMLPVLVSVWAVGVIFLSVRMLGGLLQVERLKRKLSVPAPDAWLLRLTELKARLGVRRFVDLRESVSIAAPAAMGIFRATIIVPASVFLNLPGEQIEALILHEIAHVRRHDYLINMLQTVVETLLFYHPAVWFVSRIVRIERENCCDDLAVQALGNRLLYARALTNLEEWRHQSALPVMSATGGTLMHRISRIINPTPTVARRSSVWAIVATAVISTSVAGTVLAQTAARKNPSKAKPATHRSYRKGVIKYGVKFAGSKVRSKTTTAIPVSPGTANPPMIAASARPAGAPPVAAGGFSTGVSSAPAPLFTGAPGIQGAASGAGFAGALPGGVSVASAPAAAASGGFGGSVSAAAMPKVAASGGFGGGVATGAAPRSIRAATSSADAVSTGAAVGGVQKAHAATNAGSATADSVNPASSAHSTADVKFEGGRVSVTARETDFAQLVIDIADGAEISVVIPKGQYGRVNLVLKNQGALTAIEAICKAIGVTYRMERDIMYITPADRPEGN